MCLGGLSPGEQSDPARGNIAELGDGWLPFHPQRGRATFSYIGGATVPSDHLPTGIRNTVSRSGVSSNAIIAEPGRPAPQAVARHWWKEKHQVGMRVPVAIAQVRIV